MTPVPAHHARHAERCDVVIVGGGLVGLAAAALCAQQGLSVILAERHSTTSTHPKARLVNVRSMEIYRVLGIDEDVREAGERNGGFLVADDLAAAHQPWIDPLDASAAGLSAVDPCSCDQQRIEPVLRACAVADGAHVRFGTLATDVRQDEDGVSVLLRGHRTTHVRAKYLIAADGATSAIRDQLGIGMIGRPVPGTAVSALFRADLSPALGGRAVESLFARRAQAFLFARGDGADRTWQLGTHLRPGQDPDDLRKHPDALVPVIRAATGLPKLAPAVISVLTWTSGAYTAEALRRGRVVLVGDAAHQMPPYGGFGGNTGVQDAHNLAWKIAAVCRGEADDTLLDSYATERTAAATLTVAQALLRSRKRPGDPRPQDQIDSTDLALGFRYPTSALDDATPSVEDPARPSGAPGTRAPHIGLHGAPSSTLDLLDPTGFTFVGGADSSTAAALRQEPTARLRVETVDPALVAREHRSRWEDVFAGPDSDGLLVRPDQVIAWRAPHTGTSHADEAVRTLHQFLRPGKRPR